jgi:hypothetical protein
MRVRPYEMPNAVERSRRSVGIAIELRRVSDAWPQSDVRMVTRDRHDSGWHYHEKLYCLARAW